MELIDMPAQNSGSFGKRVHHPIYTHRITPKRKNLLVWASISFATVALAVLGISQFNFSTRPVAFGEALTADSSSAFPLNGLWAPHGRSCESANSKIEFDGQNMSVISALGRVGISTYSVEGHNPVVFTVDGSQVTWDATDKDKLIPISLDPDKGVHRRSMLTLTRC